MKKPEKIAIEPEFANAPTDLCIALLQYTQSFLRDLNICIPACVYSYDRTTHKAEVMPLIKQGFFNGEWVYIPRNLISTTVRNIQCGGFTIDFPLYVGDTGWVFSSDRNTALLKQSDFYTTSVLEKDREIEFIENSYSQPPPTHEIHTFKDGFFIPDNWGGWELQRYKDDVGVNMGDAFYLGSSFDTIDADEAGGQEGDAYENKTTSSIVLHRDGGAYLLSSTRSEPEEKEDKNYKKTKFHSKVSVEGETIQIAVDDLKEESEKYRTIIMGASDGITIRQDNIKDKRHFLATAKEDALSLKIVDIEANKTVALTLENGSLNILTSDSINVFSSGNVNIKSAQSTYVSAKEARVVVENEASVTAKSVSASAEESINIAAGKTINLTAPDDINIVTAQNTTIMAKAEDANIKIETLSKGALVELNSNGESADINISSQGKDADINIKTQGDESDINVSASKYVNINGEKVYVNGNILKPGTDSLGKPVWTYIDTE